MLKDSNESIYHFITRMYEQSPILPYTFQNVEYDGLFEHSYMASKKELSLTKKEKMAIELIKIIESSINDLENREYLQNFLKANPLVIYASILNKRLRLMISERLINKEKLYSFGINLATKSENEQEVQLGIILISFNENDLTKKIVKTLGLHSSFTFYAVEAAENFSDYNQFLYELLKHTCGYGKLFTLHMFFPFKFEQQQFLLDHGVWNEVAPNLSAMICLDKPEMESFYEMLVVNKENFSKLSYLLAYAGEEYNLKQLNQGLPLIEKYITVANQFANSFIDLAAIVVIMNNMIPYMHEDETEIENGWTIEKKKSIGIKCEEIFSQQKWKYILYQELENPTHKTSLIIKVMRMLNVVPNFDSLLPLISKDVFDMDLLEFLLISHDDYYVEDVYNLLNKVLPKKVFYEKPKIMEKDEITSEYRPDIWVVFLLKALKRNWIYKEEFILKCVTARFSDVRKEAIQTLRAFKTNWSTNVHLLLEKAVEKEPITKIKNRIYRLIDKKYEKEQRYIDTSNIEIKPSPWDIPLFKTNIAGTFYRDMLVVEGRLEVGDILYLIREPDNPYDSKAILVTTEDGYVLGYVPKVDNKIPSSLLDHGEKLYGILESDDLEKGKPIIQIMINKRPTEVGKVIPFPFQEI